MLVVVSVLGCVSGPETFEDFRAEFTAAYLERCEAHECYGSPHLVTDFDCPTQAEVVLFDIENDSCDGYDPRGGGACIEDVPSWDCLRDEEPKFLDVSAACTHTEVCG
jgi:hypothetical protein